MSQEPLPALPLPPAERPGSVTAMAVIGIIFGSLAFLCTPLSLLPYFISLPQPPQGNPMLDAMKNDSMLFGWTIMSALIGWLLSIFELTGSIGALGLRQWARNILVGWSIIALLVAIVGIVFNAIYVQPKMLEIMHSQTGSAAAVGGMVGGILGLVLGIVFGVGVPAAMLIVMTRPSVKDAFARGLRPVI